MRVVNWTKVENIVGKKKKFCFLQNATVQKKKKSYAILELQIFLDTREGIDNVTKFLVFLTHILLRRFSWSEHFVKDLSHANLWYIYQIAYITDFF